MSTTKTTCSREHVEAICKAEREWEKSRDKLRKRRLCGIKATEGEAEAYKKSKEAADGAWARAGFEPPRR